MSDISVLIPTLNESGTIKDLIKNIFATTQSASLKSEVIVIDDGSSDGTREIVLELGKQYPVTLLPRDDRRGLASAVIEGASLSRNDVVLVMDGDMSHPCEAIPLLARPVLEGKSDVAIGSRYTEGGTTPDWPFKRKLASRLASFPSQLISGCEDPLAGFFATRREDLLRLGDDIEGYKICLELLLNRTSSARIIEVPIVFKDRHAGMSKMGPDIITAYFLQVFRLCGMRIPAALQKSAMGGALGGALVDTCLFMLLTSLGLHPFPAQLGGFLGGGLTTLFLTFYRSSVVFEKPAFFSSPSLLLWLLGVPFLRSGIIGLMLQGQPGALLIPGITAALFTTIFTLLFISQLVPLRYQPSHSTVVRFRLFLLSIIAFSVLLRLTFAGSFPLIQEESYYWNFAQHPDIGYLDHPPMVAALIWLGTAIFGNTEFGVRFGAQICWLVTAFFVYRITLETRNRDSALQAIAIVAVVPITFVFGLIMTPDAPMIACWSGALYYSRRAMVDGDRRAWIGVGIFLGLGLFSKYTLALLGVAWFLFMLVDNQSRRWFLKPHPWAAVLLGLLLFSPVIIWNAQHEWASFLFQTQGRLVATSEFSTHELFIMILVLITPVGLVAGCLSLWPRSGPNVLISHRQYLFNTFCVAVPLSVFILISLSKEIKFNWAGPLWLAAFPFMGVTLALVRSRKTTALLSRFQKSWLVTLVFFFVGYCGILQFIGLGIPGMQYSGANPHFGWREYSPRFIQMTDLIRTKTGELPELVGMDLYRTASGMTFYGTPPRQQKVLGAVIEQQPAIVGRDVFKTGALMYSFWYPGDGKIDQPMILIAPDKNDIHHTRLLGATPENIGPVLKMITRENGIPAPPIYFRFLNLPFSVEETRSLLDTIQQQSGGAVEFGRL